MLFTDIMKVSDLKLKICSMIMWLKTSDYLSLTDHITTDFKLKNFFH